MNIIFIGSSNISLSFLKLIQSYNLNLIVLIAKKKNNSFNDDYVDLTDYLKKNKIKFIEFNNLNSKKTLKTLIEFNSNYIFSLGSSIILNKKILSLPTNGTIGFHPTQLPFNRGKHPIIWSILLGIRKTATTFFFY